MRLSKVDQSDYEQIREALLNNFNFTERQFKRKLRESRPEKSETFRQFSSRMASYLEKWLAIAKVEITFEAVCDFLARNQFLEIVNQDMYVFLKPKSFKTLGDIARDADLFADASRDVSYCLASGQRDFKSSGQTRVETPSVKRPKFSVIFVVKLIPRMSVGIIRIRRRHRMLMLPLLSPGIREIILTGIVKVVRSMMEN